MFTHQARCSRRRGRQRPGIPCARPRARTRLGTCVVFRGYVERGTRDEGRGSARGGSGGRRRAAGGNGANNSQVPVRREDRDGAVVARHPSPLLLLLLFCCGRPRGVCRARARARERESARRLTRVMKRFSVRVRSSCSSFRCESGCVVCVCVSSTCGWRGWFA